MNIKNRLKRMEKETIKADSPVCACLKESKIHIITAPEDKERLPYACGQCGKPILYETITFKIQSNAKLTGEA